MKLARLGLTTALAVALGGTANGQIAILQIQVVEGEGGVHPPGSHTARFLTVQVTDETGKPVEGAAVSFHLPEDGPSGTFPSGLRTDVATTDAHGRATLHNLTLNQVGGRFQVRIAAIKEQARAGIVSFQYIAGPAGRPAPSAATAGSHHHARWIALAGLAGGGAAAGILAARSGRPVSASTPPGPSATSTGTSISIGSPAITVGKP